MRNDVFLIVIWDFKILVKNLLVVELIDCCDLGIFMLVFYDSYFYCMDS